MNTKSWPEVRKRKYRVQDKSGKVYTGASWFSDYRLPTARRAEEAFKPKKNAIDTPQTLRIEQVVEQKHHSIHIWRT